MAIAPAFRTFHSSKDGAIVEGNHEAQELKENEVLIKITYSGVCGTDLHGIGRGMVLGHEGVGTVQGFAPGAKNQWKIGERVGFGYVKDGCGVCEFCLAGTHMHCTTSPRFYAGHDFDQGSFATQAIWPETLLHRVPEELSDAEAAPLFCAGQTVFMPLLRHVRPGDRLGVVGVGGLGHLAIQFASKWGCEVVAFSHSEDKREEAFRLGAKEFVVAKGAKELNLEHKLDHLFATTNKHPDWALYMPVMRPFGKIYPLTVTDEPLVIPFGPFLHKELQMVGSCTSTPIGVEKMLHFAAVNGIKPVIEEYPMSVKGIEDAIQRLRSGEVRYRGVLKA